MREDSEDLSVFVSFAQTTCGTYTFIANVVHVDGSAAVEIASLLVSLVADTASLLKLSLNSPDPVHLVFEDDGAIRVEPVDFPDTDGEVERDGFSFCRRFWCPCRPGKQPLKYPVVPDGLSATVHQDCFNLYMRWAEFPEPKRRLWKISTLRAPWPGCEPLLLEPEPDLARVGRLLAGIFESTQLPFLPQEINMLIAEHLGSSSDVLRFSCVQETVEVAAQMGLEDAVSIHLGQIVSWDRGGKAVVNSDMSLLVVEVMIDARGIKTIESIPGARRTPRSPWTAYKQIPPGQNIRLDLLSGIMSFPNKIGGPGFFNWSEEYPIGRAHTFLEFPSWLFAIPYGKPKLTVDLALCTGITFFMGLYDTYAVHAHSATGPNADVTFRKIEDSLQADATWLYVPISKADQVEAFGIRAAGGHGHERATQLAYLLRTRLTGDIAVGRCENRTFEDHTIYTDPSSSHLVWFLDRHHLMYVPGGVTMALGKCYNLGPCISEAPVPMENPYFSMAKTHDVSTAWVFRDKDTRNLRGLVFEYSDGGERAVGSCRTGLDLVERCTNLSCLQFYSCQIPVTSSLNPPPLRSRPLNVVHVRQSDEVEAGWTICPKRGWIEMWFNHHELVMMLTCDDDTAMSEEVLGAGPPAPPWEGLGSLDSWSVQIFE